MRKRRRDIGGNNIHRMGVRLGEGRDEHTKGKSNGGKMLP